MRQTHRPRTEGSCSGVTRLCGEQFGDSFARRIDAYSEFEWIQPASLISDEQVFAWYDTERRLKGLRELLHEALLDLGSLDE